MTQGTYDDFFDALGLRESSDNYQAVNSAGFLGRYQLGEPALIDVGIYTDDGNFEDAQDADPETPDTDDPAEGEQAASDDPTRG
ncbi:hypothetical protein [Hyphococcus sp.]|uniref:hypothetical protein n=1 Tax=Hyphococcus sp. TaxID=2038636 RepID=UPI003CCBE534